MMEKEKAEITELTAKYGRVQSLMRYVNKETLAKSYSCQPRGKAVGVDGVTKEAYGENLSENLDDLLKRMKQFSYKPYPVRRAYIPKGNGKMRGLGIPSFEDKVVQGVFKEILEGICEQKFLDFSYGFRPNRSCHDAIQKVNKHIMADKVNYVVDADIKGFFDNIDHDWMGKNYFYYQCVTNRRDKSCEKKAISKSRIEDLVITKTRKLLTRENIDRIASEVVRLCEQERNTDNLKSLKKLLKENERATENLFKALEGGQLIDILAERISQKKKEHDDLERQILLEETTNTVPTVNEIRFFLNQFRKGDINDVKYRQALVDTFINKIYLYEDKMTVLYNTQDSHTEITLDNTSLSRVGLVEPRGIEPLSESNLERTSPGAVCYLHSLIPAGTNTLRDLVAS